MQSSVENRLKILGWVFHAHGNKAVKLALSLQSTAEHRTAVGVWRGRATEKLQAYNKPQFLNCSYTTAYYIHKSHAHILYVSSKQRHIIG